MKNVDILFLVEHSDRELDAVSCISAILQSEYGLSCVVANFYSDLVPLARYEPRVLALPFFYFLDHAPMRNYVARWPNARLVNLAWEQINYKMNMDIKVPQDEFAKKRVTHFCWTSAYQDLLSERGVARELAILCGNPVMKFYDEPYRRYFKSRAELAKENDLDPARRWILFPENYRWGFLNDRQIKTFERNGGNLKYILEARDYCRRSLAEVLRWFAALDRDDDPLIILRPRPATAISDMRQFGESVLGKIPANVRLVKADSAREWILASDAVMSSYSTTLIESALVGKPIYVACPEPFPEALEDEWYGYIQAVNAKDEFVAVGRERFDAGNSSALSNWARQRFFGFGDPLRAMAEAFASAAGAARSEAPRPIPKIPYSEKALGQIWNALVRRPRLHRLIRKFEPEFSFTYEKHEKDVFSAGDVYKRVAKWEKLLHGGSWPNSR